MIRRNHPLEDELLLEFCERGFLRGQYLPQVRVGRSLLRQPELLSAEENAIAGFLKAIDAVCIFSREHDFKLVEHNIALARQGIRGLGNRWVARNVKEDLKSNGELFHNEKVALIEVKSGRLDYSAIGQLLVYRVLFNRDWPTAKVDQLWIVATEDDDFIRPACKELDIKVWIKELQSNQVSS